jgi:transposase
VTQVRRFGGRCACCGERLTAAAPAGLAPGSPFGHSIAAMVVYLHYAHAISLERLAALMDKVFSLPISKGAIQQGGDQQHIGPIFIVTASPQTYPCRRRLGWGE